MIRLNVTMSEDLYEKLDTISEQDHQTKSEILRKALYLFEVARQGKREGKKLTLVDENSMATTEIVGL